MGPDRLERERTLSASELRKANKPVMEKRRRARINESLTQLKSLVLDALKRDTSRYSKLEKADILEMTVKHLRTIQRSQMAAAMVTDSTVVGKYRAGFAECATEVMRYLSTIDGLVPEVRSRLINHMVDCLHKVSAPPIGSQAYPYPQPMPNATPLAAMPGSFPTGSESKMAPNGAFHVIPTALPNGQVLFVPSYAVAGTQPTATVSTSPEQHHVNMNRTSFTPPPTDGISQSLLHQTPESSCLSSVVKHRSPSPDLADSHSVNIPPLCHSSPQEHKPVITATFPCTSPDSASCSSDSFSWSAEPHSPPARHVVSPPRCVSSPTERPSMLRTTTPNDNSDNNNKENQVYLYIATENHDINNNVEAKLSSVPFQFPTVQVKVEPSPAPQPPAQQCPVPDRDMWRPW